MRICEIFKSIQGEGSLVGIVSVFARVSGCNLRCRWCDAKFASYEETGKDISIKGLINEIMQQNCQHVVITGGEPLLDPQIPALTRLLKHVGLHVTIETNATILKEDLACDLVSMSPKLSHSTPLELSTAAIEHHERNRINFEAIRHYVENYDYQIKFVVRNNERDIQEIEHFLSNLEYDPTKVFLMPLASTREELFEVQEEIINLCIKHGLRYANRLQLQVWDTQKGK